jgi:carboxypeptidase PM20D1
LKRLKKLDRKKRLDISIVNYKESADPIPESRIDNEAYKILSSTIQELVNKVAVVPNLVTVTTDSKYMSEITDNIYRLSPMILRDEDLSTIHSQNESISLKNYGLVLAFYKTVITKLCIRKEIHG